MRSSSERIANPKVTSRKAAHRNQSKPSRRASIVCASRPMCCNVAKIDRPVSEADEVLLQVDATGADRGTWHLMAGLPYAARLVVRFRAPKGDFSGLDAPGLVVAVGSEVTRFQPCDEVFGISKGSSAEFARSARGTSWRATPQGSASSRPPPYRSQG